MPYSRVGVDRALKRRSRTEVDKSGACKTHTLEEGVTKHVTLIFVL